MNGISSGMVSRNLNEHVSVGTTSALAASARASALSKQQVDARRRRRKKKKSLLSSSVSLRGAKSCWRLAPSRLERPRTLSRAGAGRTAARKRAASTNRRSRRRHTSREGHTFTPQVSLDKKLAQNFAQMLKLANWNGRCRRLNGE